MNNSTNKRLAKNTLFLYFRMFIIMAVTFFTTRVVLDKLGVDDYGIFNTIGGIVVLFTFINNAMVTATQRFLNFYLGKNDIDKVKLFFSLSLLTHILIGIVVMLLTEGVGLWFLYNKMSLPPERFNAAFWVLQISTLITFSRIIRSPYNACIIAYEKMDFYAYISIIDVILKLLIVYMLSIVDFDKLILYSILTLVVSLAITYCYKFYCNHKFPISHFTYQWDKKSFKEIFNFSGFSLLGNMANMVTQQGVNMIINSFCGVAVNAAIGVSSQLSHGVYSFITNFQVAFNPVLVKTYAKNEIEELKQLIYKVSKLSFYLMFCISIPLIIYSKEYLGLWLKEVPDFTVAFCQLTILSLLIDTLAEPLWKTVQATGKIKVYQIMTSIILLSNLPLCYLALLMGYSPIYTFIVRLAINLIAYLYRYYYSKFLIHFSHKEYFKNTIAPILYVTTMILIISYLIMTLKIHYIPSTIIIIIISILVTYFLGMTSSEKEFIKEIVKKKIGRKQIK